MTKFKFPFVLPSLTQELKCTALHEAILNAREAALNTGRITASNWEEAKERIKKNVNGFGSGI